jgi:putative hydroxymethylpyrimidine transport system permease protein
MRAAARAAIVTLGLVLAWQALVSLLALPHYILPTPGRVLLAGWNRLPQLLGHASVTLLEIVLGLLIGTALGALAALAMTRRAGLRRWLLPVVVLSQAIPVFALAPILVLWLGYGLASKVAMAVLIIFFPVTASFFDGLRRTEPGWLDLARTMTAGTRRQRWAELRHIRLPAALPALGSGLRIAAAVAPIGAVIGEWVGSSAGLGYLMLHANARLQIDLMFAALLLLGLIAVALYFAVDWAVRRLVPWQAEQALP